ncbi:MAG: M28 family peptidase [Gemmatimonadota bacterium]
MTDPNRTSRLGRSAILLLAVAMLSATAGAQEPARSVQLKAPTGKSTKGPLPLKYVGPKTVPAITAGDLMTRLYKFADDSMMGRAAGTPWNDIGTAYIASEFKRLGLKPAGDSGTYFQHPLVRREIAEGSVRIGDRVLEAWKDFAPRDQGSGAKEFDGALTIFGGVVGDTSTYLPADAVAGKVVVLRLPEVMKNNPNALNINRVAVSRRYSPASAIVVALPVGMNPATLRTGGVTMKTEDVAAPTPSWAYFTPADINALLGANADSVQAGFTGLALRGKIKFVSNPAPGRNVVAILPGSDPKLKGEFVAIGAHNDHVGFNNRPVDHDSVKAVMMHAAPQGADSPPARPTEQQWAAIRVTIDSLRKLHPSRVDSIYNGADDDGSGSMTLVEIAEALAGQKVAPKRSILFVSHVAEELGLFGARFFNDHPTVARDSVVAQLNIDMVGRGGANDVTGEGLSGDLLKGGPGYLQLIGSRRLSTELGDLVESVNKTKKLGINFDYALDANGHPQNIYCRSDHYEYARNGIPITFFTTGGHADYHQVTDEPQYINYDGMAKIATLIYETAKTVAGLDHRVVVDKPKPDPNGTCKQ